ncbi:MAG TPA: hypothetical protein V6D27_00750 [Vampirovibrionales bacterium]
MPNFIIHTICTEPDGIPGQRFITDEGKLPASVPGASGNKILGVTDTAAAFGESVAVIVSGSASVEVVGPAGAYEDIVISGVPPTATKTVVNNGAFISSNALGQAVAGLSSSLLDVGVVAPNQYAKLPGDLVEVLLKL